MTDTHTTDCPYHFHASHRLFALLDAPVAPPSAPEPVPAGGPIEVLCQKWNQQNLICTYLSPLDAVMGSHSLHERPFWPVNFQYVDPRPFMAANGFLGVALHYAYAADRNHLVIDRLGQPVMLFLTETFKVPYEQWDHFRIEFGQPIVALLNTLFSRGELASYDATLKKMANWSPQEVSEAEQQAFAARPPVVRFDDLSGGVMNQYAVYDPLASRWIFADAPFVSEGAKG